MSITILSGPIGAGKTTVSAWDSYALFEDASPYLVCDDETDTGSIAKRIRTGLEKSIFAMYQPITFKRLKRSTVNSHGRVPS
jgi:hypothetical protein